MSIAPLDHELDKPLDPAPGTAGGDSATGTQSDHYVDDYLGELLGDVLHDAATADAVVTDAIETETVAAPVAAVAAVAAVIPVAAATPLRMPARETAAPVARIAPERRTTEPASRPVLTPLAQATRWLRVAIDADSYALELLRVQEVVRVAPIVRMRGAAASVLGVMNLRGRIVPVFDLGRWLGAGHVTPTERARIVVVERADELIGLLVSAVDDVVTLGRERIEPPMVGSTSGPMADAVIGIARVGATPTVLLDANALFGG